jgi:hypothetical protein
LVSLSALPEEDLRRQLAAPATAAAASAAHGTHPHRPRTPCLSRRGAAAPVACRSAIAPLPPSSVRGTRGLCGCHCGGNSRELHTRELCLGRLRVSHSLLRRV